MEGGVLQSQHSANDDELDSSDITDSQNYCWFVDPSRLWYHTIWIGDAVALLVGQRMSSSSSSSVEA